MKIKKVLFLISIIALSFLSIMFIVESIQINKSDLLVTDEEKSKVVMTFLLFGISLLVINIINFVLIIMSKIRSYKLVDLLMAVFIATYLVFFLINNLKTNNILTIVLTIICSIFILYEIVFDIMEIGGYEK